MKTTYIPINADQDPFPVTVDKTGNVFRGSTFFGKVYSGNRKGVYVGTSIGGHLKRAVAFPDPYRERVKKTVKRKKRVVVCPPYKKECWGKFTKQRFGYVQEDSLAGVAMTCSFCGKSSLAASAWLWNPREALKGIHGAIRIYERSIQQLRRASGKILDINPKVKVVE